MEMAHTKGATLKKKYSLRHFCVFLMFFQESEVVSIYVVDTISILTLMASMTTQ